MYLYFICSVEEMYMKLSHRAGNEKVIPKKSIWPNKKQRGSNPYWLPPPRRSRYSALPLALCGTTSVTPHPRDQPLWRQSDYVKPVAISNTSWVQWFSNKNSHRLTRQTLRFTLGLWIPALRCSDPTYFLFGNNPNLKILCELLWFMVLATHLLPLLHSASQRKVLIWTCKDKYIVKQFEGGWGQKLILAANCAVDFKHHFPQFLFCRCSNI